MQVLESIAEVRAALGPMRQVGRRIGLVPTMGALHAGHWSLVDRARQRCDHVVVSIFVNPLQFGPDEDLDAYPRTLDGDLKGCAGHGCDWVFTPSVREMYPGTTLTRVTVRRLSEPLCGRRRQGHFDGVATVVCKLFNAVGPDAAFFGEKDFQQLVVIRRMVRDLNMPVEIVGCATVREPDGLAVSSRNAYLDPRQRLAAAAIFRALCEAGDAVRAGQREARPLTERVAAQIAAAGATEVEYVEVVDPDTLEDIAQIDRPARMCVAAGFGRARLIDNLALDAGAADG